MNVTGFVVRGFVGFLVGIALWTYVFVARATYRAIVASPEMQSAMRELDSVRGKHTSSAAKRYALFVSCIWPWGLLRESVKMMIRR